MLLKVYGFGALHLSFDTRSLFMFSWETFQKQKPILRIDALECFCFISIFAPITKIVYLFIIVRLYRCNKLLMPWGLVSFGLKQVQVRNFQAFFNEFIYQFQFLHVSLCEDNLIIPQVCLLDGRVFLALFGFYFQSFKLFLSLLFFLNNFLFFVGFMESKFSFPQLLGILSFLTVAIFDSFLAVIDKLEGLLHQVLLSGEPQSFLLEFHQSIIMEIVRNWVKLLQHQNISTYFKMRPINQLLILEAQIEKSISQKRQSEKNKLKLKSINRLALVDDQCDFGLYSQRKIVMEPTIVTPTKSLSLKQTQGSTNYDVEESIIYYCFKCDDLATQNHECRWILDNIAEIQRSIERIHQTIINFNLESRPIMSKLKDIDETSNIQTLSKINKELKKEKPFSQLEEEKIILDRMINVSGKKLALLI